MFPARNLHGGISYETHVTPMKAEEMWRCSCEQNTVEPHGVTVKPQRQELVKLVYFGEAQLGAET